MPTAFDAYSRPQQQPFGQPKTAFGALSSQQAKDTGYQSVPQMAQQQASKSASNTLEQNQNQSYRNYIDRVVDATLPENEADLRAPYIPEFQAAKGYGGSNYTNQNVAMSKGAIPAAYEYAGIRNGDFDYGVDRLEWGGPASGKSRPNDWLDMNRIVSERNAAEDALRRAVIPRYLRNDVADKLATKWTNEWLPEFQGMANDRRLEQANWWGGSDWANESFRPAWTEQISPAERRELSPFIPGRPGADPIPYQPAIPPRRELVTPEQTAIEASRRLVSPEVQGREAVAAGYYTPSQAEYMAWVDQERQRQQDEEYQQYKVYDPSGNGAYSIINLNLSEPADTASNAQLLSLMNGLNTEQSPVFTGSQADAWQEEFDRHSQNLSDLYGFWKNRRGSWNLDPKSQDNGFYRNDQFYGGSGRIVNDFLDGTGTDSYGTPFNSDLGYTYFGDEAKSLKVTSMFPDIWGNHQPGQAAIPYQPAVYEDIPAREYRPAVYKEIPGQPERAYVPGITAIPDTPAVYKDIPEVTTTHPSEPKDGFQTLIDPITGTAIPNWWLNGGLGSNRDLSETYGTPQWYIR